MANVVNVLFGIAIATILFLTVLMGIQTFHPEPEYNDYCNDTFRTPKTIVENETQEQIDKRIEYDNTCSNKYQEARKNWSLVPFFVGIIIGAILLVISFILWNNTTVAAGLASAGIILIFYGFIIGWRSASNEVKFVTMIIIAALVIFLSTKLQGKKK